MKNAKMHQRISMKNAKNTGNISMKNAKIFLTNQSKCFKIQQQLNANFENIYYWKNNNTAEVDFIIQNRDGLIPIEVKAGDTVRSKSLNLYMQQFKPKYGIRVCTKNFGFANGIKTIPLYSIFLIK